MTTLNNIISDFTQIQHATSAGINMHSKLRQIIIDNNTHVGDKQIIQKILSTPSLPDFFGPTSKTEVPIAGTIHNRFISRRIDRLNINHDTKTISILDYKTDINRHQFYNDYINQINEYATLLHNIYPNYRILGYILWTHDFSLENIQIKQL